MFIVRNIRIHRLSNHLGLLNPILLSPLLVLDFYRQQGRKFGVSLMIKNEADPDKLQNARSKEQADEIMKSANSRVSVLVSQMSGTTDKALKISSTPTNNYQ